MTAMAGAIILTQTLTQPPMSPSHTLVQTAEQQAGITIDLLMSNNKWEQQQ